MIMISQPLNFRTNVTTIMKIMSTYKLENMRWTTMPLAIILVTKCNPISKTIGHNRVKV